MTKPKTSPARKPVAAKTPAVRKNARLLAAPAQATTSAKPFTRSARFWRIALYELAELKRETGSCTITTVSSRQMQNIAQSLRRSREEGTLPTDVQEVATDLGFAWTTRDDTRWEIRFAEAQAFHQTYGHCSVEQNNPHHRKLAVWLTKQRQLLRAGQVPPDRKALLAELGVTGDKILKSWAERLSELKAHVAANSNWLDSGAAGVPTDLLAWVEKQRRMLVTGKLSPEQEAALATVGIVKPKDTDAGGHGYDRMMYKRVSVLAATHNTCDFARIRDAMSARNGGELTAEVAADLCGMEAWLGKMREAHARNTLTGQWKGRLNRLPDYVDPLLNNQEISHVRDELVRAQAVSSGLAHESTELRTRVATLETELAAARSAVDAARIHSGPVLKALMALEGAAFEGVRARFLQELVQEARGHVAELGSILGVPLKAEEHPVAESGLGARGRNALRSEGLLTLEQIAETCSRTDLYRMPGMGAKTIAEVIEELRIHGLRLKPDPVRPGVAKPVPAEPEATAAETNAADPAAGLVKELAVETTGAGPTASEIRAELEAAAGNAAPSRIHMPEVRRTSVGARVLSGLRLALGLGGRGAQSGA